MGEIDTEQNITENVSVNDNESHSNDDEQNITENVSVSDNESHSNDDDIEEEYVIISSTSEDSSVELCCGRDDSGIANVDDTIDDHEPVIPRVSPMRVFRIVTTSQRRCLWNGDTSPYACPIALGNYSH